jgi:hypothetical protein
MLLIFVKRYINYFEKDIGRFYSLILLHNFSYKNLQVPTSVLKNPVSYYFTSMQCKISTSVLVLNSPLITGRHTPQRFFVINIANEVIFPLHTNELEATGPVTSRAHVRERSWRKGGAVLRRRPIF